MSQDKVVGRAVIRNPQGLHMRPISALTKVAREYACNIQVKNGDVAADGKAVMELLSLAVDPGTELVIEATGVDAAAAVAALTALIDDGFGLDDEDNTT